MVFSLNDKQKDLLQIKADILIQSNTNLVKTMVTAQDPIALHEFMTICRDFALSLTEEVYHHQFNKN